MIKSIYEECEEQEEPSRSFIYKVDDHALTLVISLVIDRGKKRRLACNSLAMQIRPDYIIGR